MKQPKAVSLLESTINISVGFCISVALQATFLPLMGVPIPWSVNFIFAAIMTVVSIARSYLLRRLFEALHFREPLTTGMLAVIAECRRQREIEKFDEAHDDANMAFELARAGACYAMAPGQPRLHPRIWPWDAEWWKPQDVRRDLERAAALIIAELDRYFRLRKRREVHDTLYRGAAE